MPAICIKTYPHVDQDFNGDWMATGMGLPDPQIERDEFIITENIDRFERYNFVGRNTVGREINNRLDNFYTIKMRDGTEYHFHESELERLGLRRID